MENRLIAIQTTENGQTVSARELYLALGIQKDFTDWFKYQAERAGLIDGSDFSPILGESTGGRPQGDYILSLDTAKHLAMMSGGEKAHLLRDYFIKVEKAWNSPEAVMARAQQIAQRTIANLTANIQVLLPKAQSYDILMDSTGCLTMNEAAKILDIKGIGQNKLFHLLLLERIIYKKGDIYLPMQEYKSHFIVKQRPVKIGDMMVERSQLFVSTAGLDWLAHKLIDKGYQCNYWKGKTA